MEILFKQKPRSPKIQATMNGVTTEYKANFLKKQTFNDVLQWVEEETKKELRKQK